MTLQLNIKTAEQLQAEAMAAHQASVTRVIDQHVEAQAKAMEYNNAATLASYASSTKPEWATEAQAFVAWRDAVWDAAIAMQAAAVASGEVPSVDDVIAALPDWE